MQKTLVGLAPWSVFTVVATRSGLDAVGAAAVLAFPVALGLVIRSTRRAEAVQLLEITVLMVFGGYAQVVLTAPTTEAFLAHHGRAAAAAPAGARPPSPLIHHPGSPE